MAGTVLCLTSNSNDYTEFGTLWTQAETDDTTETATDGSSTQTNLYDDDTKQVSPDEIRVMANEKSSAGSHTETSKLRLDDLGYRKELTHSADTIVIETSAPATTAGAKQAEPTVTQSSQSSWGLDETSDSKMKLTVQATEASGTDSYITDILFGSDNFVTTVGKHEGHDSFGNSTLDIAADGTKTVTDSSWRETMSADNDGFTLLVTGQFADADGAGTLSLTAFSGNKTTGHDTTAGLNGSRHHMRDDAVQPGRLGADADLQRGRGRVLDGVAGVGAALGETPDG